jgi:hypothetical protein
MYKPLLYVQSASRGHRKVCKATVQHLILVHVSDYIKAYVLILLLFVYLTTILVAKIVYSVEW